MKENDEKEFDRSTWPKTAIPHVKKHGHICFTSAQGHYCPNAACEVNFQPRNLNLIFDIIDRGEYE